MPFASKAQEGWLRVHHPDIARRWTSEFGTYKGSQNFKPSPSSDSNEAQKSSVSKLPRRPGKQRDYAALTPSEIARHKPARASESEAMSEGATEASPGVRRGEKMSLKDGTSGFALRDSKLAGRRRV